MRNKTFVLLWIALLGSSPCQFVLAKSSMPTLTLSPSAATKKELAEAKRLQVRAQRLALVARFADAILLYEKALEIRERIQGEHIDVADLLWEMASVFSPNEQDGRKQALLSRCLVIRQKQLGEDHEAVLRVLGALGESFLDRKDRQKAEEHYVNLLNKAIKFKKPDFVVLSSFNLYIIYSTEENFSKMESMLKFYIENSKRCTGWARTRLAKIYIEQGMSRRALLQNEQAYRDVLRGNCEDEKNNIDESRADLLERIGMNFKILGKNDLARKCSEMSRRLLVAEGVVDDKDSIPEESQAEKLMTDGDRLFDQKKYVDAESRYNNALLRGSYGIMNEYAILKVIRILLLNGKFTEAISLMRKHFLGVERKFGYVRVFGTEERLSQFMAMVRPQEDMIYSFPSLHRFNPLALQLALTAALSRKGRALDEISQTTRYLSADAGALPLMNSLARLYADVQREESVVRGTGSSNARLRQLEAQVEELDQRLVERTADSRERFDEIPPAHDIARQVVANLVPGQALVEVVQFRPLLLHAGGATPQFGEAHYLAFVARPGQANGTHINIVTAHNLGPSVSLDRAVATYRRLLGDQRSALSEIKAVGEAIYLKIFAPLLPGLEDSRDIFLSLDGELQQLPFAALHDGQSFLLDRYHFSYLSSGRDLLRKTPAQHPTNLSVVVFADPTFELPSTGRLASALPSNPMVAAHLRGFRAPTLSLSVQRLEPLPGTRLEADRLRVRFPAATVLTGDLATEQRFLSQRAPDIIHVATHGLFLEDGVSEIPSYRGRGFKSVSSTTLSTDAAVENGPSHPLHALGRAALAFAGARARASADPDPADDGLVSALEVSLMDLHGTQLVVLSACDTGRGVARSGQGLFGFRRSFFLAGAETLVTSLWSIDDRATSDLMDRYYARLLQGQGRAAAMEDAMKATRAERPHPFYWAPFIVMGRNDPIRGLKPAPAR